MPMALFPEARPTQTPSSGRFIVVLLLGTIGALLAVGFAVAMALRSGEKRAPPPAREKPAEQRQERTYDVDLE